MDFWIPLLGSALGGALITSTFGLIKIRQDKSLEHARWLRNEKVETYSNYLETVRLGDLMLEQVLTGASTREDALEFKDHIGGFRLRLISPETVRQATKLHRDSRNAFTEFLGESPLGLSKNPEFHAASEALYEARLHLAEVMAQDLRLTL
ncbi:hypothetical protein ACTAQI_03870 [Pseudarthrobacter sp. alpha12b]